MIRAYDDYGNVVDLVEYEDNLLQSFAQWLWDNAFLTDEAFTVRLVEQYREEIKGGAENDNNQ